MAFPKLTDSTFEGLVNEATRPVIVFYHAEGSVACNQMRSTLDDMWWEFPEDVKLVEFCTTNNPRITSHFGMDQVSALVLYDHGSERSRLVGVPSKDYLRRWLGNSLRR